MRLGLGGTGDRLEGAAESVQGFALPRGHLGEHALGIDGTVADRPAGRARGSAPGNQAFKGGVGVGAGQPCPAGDEVAGGWAKLEQRPVDQGLRRREPERCQIDSFRSSRSYY